MEHKLLTGSFSRSVLAEMPSIDHWRVEEGGREGGGGEGGRRRDLRKSHLIFSIDPEGCEDVDDTLSVR